MKNIGYGAGKYQQRNRVSQERKLELISAIKLEQITEVLRKLNNGQNIIKTRSKQLLEHCKKELSQNSIASQKRQKYDQLFRGSMKCV